MNRKQKLLTGFALVAFTITVFCAPWQDSTADGYGGAPLNFLEYRPIWCVSGIYEQHHLLWAPLVGTWIAIAVIYSGLFFLLKNKGSRPHERGHV